MIDQIYIYSVETDNVNAIQVTLENDPIQLSCDILQLFNTESWDIC